MKNFAWSFFNTFLSKGFSFVFSIILGNLLLPGDLGVFVTVLLVISYLVSVFSFGIGQSLVQKLNDTREVSLHNHYFSAGIVLLVFLSGIGCLLFLSLHDFIFELFDLQVSPGVSKMVVWLIPLNIFREYFSHILQANVKFKKLTLYNLSSVLTQILVTLLLVYYYEMNLRGVFYGLYAGGIVAFVLLLFSVYGKYSLVLSTEALQSSFRLIRFSSLIFIGSFALILDRRIDVLFVSYFLESADVAVYNYALKFSLLFLLAGNSMSKVTYPKLTNAFTSGDLQYVRKIMNFSLDFAFLGLSLLTLLFLFNARYIIQAVLPEYYLQVIPFLPVLFIGILPKAVFSSIGTLFTAKGMPAITAKINWIMVSVNIVLNILLIPVLGLYGAAIATSVSFLGQPVFIILMLIKHLNIQFPVLRILTNLVLAITLIGVGSLIPYIWIKELLILGYAFYCFFIFLSSEEKSFLFKELKQIHYGIFFQQRKN
ncbi:MAG: lipopolysaccharide biosynthesis protein [Bacteroidales bacterium]